MFFDRVEGGETAVLVHLNFSNYNDFEDIKEFEALVRSTGVEIVDLIQGKVNYIRPNFFVGSGKADEIRQSVIDNQAQVVIVNHALSPPQEKNLEAHTKCRVIDRTGLILDIFAQRAKTFEGKLQVELAQLRHISTRLVRGWQHLERQKGGIGLRGPGEKQLETDRRLLRQRIKCLQQRLKKVQQQREISRNSRKKASIYQVSLVGYTNAGKSTLFNKLTKANVLSEDRLFATLDPTIRKICLPSIGHAVIADTVGFIRHLPHTLVESFKATLEEVSKADLLLHVIDASVDDPTSYAEQVRNVLREIGADHIEVIDVYNKIDLLAEDVGVKVKRDSTNMPLQVSISSTNDIGLELLKKCIAERLNKNKWHGIIKLKPSQGKLRSLLHTMNFIKKEMTDDRGTIIATIEMPKLDFDRIKKQQNLSKDHYKRIS